MRISDWSSDVCSSDLGDREGFGPDMAGRLDHQPIAPRREDIAPAAFEFGHRVALAAAAEDAVSEREYGLRGFDRQIAHQRLFGELADHLAALHERSEEHTSVLQSLMRKSYALFRL